MNLSEEVRRAHVLTLLNMTEVCDPAARTKAVRALLYLCQGTFVDCNTPEQHARNVRDNVLLLYNCGAFTAFVQLLNIEVGMSLLNMEVRMYACDVVIT